ncbi:MAG: hypothetical protein AB7E51_06635 [Pseudodesulfovibrio sp.]|uniref:hypothetical protein n=1 Tax=Pseudodesulfovibrio sp. TaxID=2035812 RepID=UPI003D0DCB94
MKVKPMLCKGTVVRAIMDGRQAQDRRPIGNSRVWASDLIMDTDVVDGKEVSLGFEDAAGRWHKTEERAPYQPGDIIWVREPGKVLDVKDYAEDGMDLVIEYLADGKGANIEVPSRMSEAWEIKYKDRWPVPDWVAEHQGIPNGIFKEACRLFLKVTAVRVERIQDISQADAMAEGIFEQPGGFAYQFPDGHWERTHDPRLTFKFLWADLYPGSWERNDWVWVTEFERTEKPAGWPGN